MTTLLEAVLRSDRALAALDETLIRRARDLHRRGYRSPALSPSQMNAVGDLLIASAGFPDAVASVEAWMKNQLAKLREEESRKGKPRSWLLPLADGGAGETCLGDELVAWMREERYLEGSPPPDLDRLAALRRFWERFHGFYRYRNETGEDLPLAALDLRKKGDGPE